MTHGKHVLQTARTIFTALTEGRGFDRVLRGVNITEAAEGRCVCEFVVGEDHVNRGGTLHGGLTATLVDIVSTIAIATTGSGAPGVSTGMNITYISAANEGDKIEVDAKVLRAGRTLAFATVDLRKVDGKIVAQGTHTKFVGSSK
eukprot:Opistho-2@83781